MEELQYDLTPRRENLAKLRAMVARLGVHSATNLGARDSAQAEHVLTHGHRLRYGCCRPSR